MKELDKLKQMVKTKAFYFTLLKIALIIYATRRAYLAYGFEWTIIILGVLGLIILRTISSKLDKWQTPTK